MLARAHTLLPRLTLAQLCRRARKRRQVLHHSRKSVYKYNHATREDVLNLWMTPPKCCCSLHRVTYIQTFTSDWMTLLESQLL